MTVANKSLDENSEAIRIKTILLADDDEFARDFTKTVLKMAGYEVIDAINGEDAVLKFELFKDRIDLLVLDVAMPKKNGFEAYQAMKNISSMIKVIFISGYINDLVSRKEINSRSMTLISKPFAPAELVRQISSLLYIKDQFMPIK